MRALVLLALLLAAPAAAASAPVDAPRAGAWTASGEVVYEARDALATWRGRAALARATVAFDPGRPEALAVEAVVRPADFRSGNVARDANARITVFEVATHPEAVARVTADPAAGPPRADGDGVEVPVSVALTLHGVTRVYPALARLARDGDGWVGTLELTVSVEAHGMRRPRLLGLVTEDAVRLEVVVRVRPTP